MRSSALDDGEYRARGLFAAMHGAVTLEPRAPTRATSLEPRPATRATSPEPRAPTRASSAMQVDRPPGSLQAPRASDSSLGSGEDLRMLTNTQLDEL